MKKVLLFILVIFIVGMAFSFTVQAAKNDESNTIKVFFTSDVYARVTEARDEQNQLMQIGYARLATFIEDNSQNASGTLILDGGNVFHGAPFANLEKGQSIAQILKAVGYDAVAIGNHDLSYGGERLDTLGEQSRAQILSANIKENNKNRYGNSFIKEIDDIKIGVFALSSPQYATKVNPDLVEAWDFGDSASIINDAKIMTEQLRQQGADIIIALTHLGLEPNEYLSANDIAQNVPHIDFILDGNNQASFDNGGFVVEKGVLIMEVGQNMSKVGMVTITQDDDKFHFSPQVFAAADLAEYDNDEDIEKLIKDISAAQEQVLSTVIASTPIDLDGENSHVRSQDTNLARLIATSYKQAANAEISLLNGGDIRQSIAKGPITKGDILNVLTFDNVLVTKKIKGSAIIEALNHGMVYGQGSFPHFDGMVVQYEKVDENTFDGEKTSRSKVLNISVNGQMLQEDREYLVAMSNFLATGGDGYTMLADPEIEQLFGSTTDVFIDFISQANDELILEIDQDIRLTTDNPNQGQDFSRKLTIIILVCVVLIIIYLIYIKRKRKRIF
ncbi:MAG: bifunctional metallophosphatase/5'-nucleotidase [Bacillota bacterium]|jgi:5'-nucleotidase/UDP-sugar diphosphatase